MNASADVMNLQQPEERVDIATMLDWLTRDEQNELHEDSAVVQLSYKVGIVVVILLFVLGAVSLSV